MEDKQLHLNYLDEAYEELCRLDHGNEQKTVLARFKNTGKMVVKKQVSAGQGGIYQQLRVLLHPNLVQIHDICFTRDGCVIIEDFVSGQTLEERLRHKGKLSMDETMHYMMQLMDGLMVIQRFNIVHRDLTPQNILISTDGVIKILDFGIARFNKVEQTKDTAVLGTVGYASPEQFGFLQTDVRTDIYALGVLLNNMITGKMPNEELLGDKHLREIVLKCTHIDPDKRYTSVADLKKALGLKEMHRVSGPDKSIWPGFRTGFLWKKILAGIGYGLMAFYFVMTIKDTFTWQPQYIILDILSYIIFLWGPFFISSNFGRWDRKIPPFSKMSKEATVTIRVIASFVTFFYGIELETYIRLTLVGLPLD